MNKQNKNRLIDAETKGVFTRGDGVGGWVKNVKGKIVNNSVISFHGER